MELSCLLKMFDECTNIILVFFNDEGVKMGGSVKSVARLIKTGVLPDMIVTQIQGGLHEAYYIQVLPKHLHVSDLDFSDEQTGLGVR